MIIPRFLITSPSKSEGKTTVAAAFLAVLTERFRSGRLNTPPAAVKFGSFGADPLFLPVSKIVQTGLIDRFFTSSERTLSLFVHDTEGASLAVCDGAGGYFDCTSDGLDYTSSFAMARELKCPVLLVVDVRQKNSFVCDELNRFLLRGEKNNDRSCVSAVLLNRCSSSLFRTLAPAVEKRCGVRVLGYLEDSVDTKPCFEKSVDVEGLINLALSAPELGPSLPFPPFVYKNEVPVRIAVARDHFFNFYYRENLDLLTSFGAELVPFSPLADSKIPDGCRGLYLGGSDIPQFPFELIENAGMAESVRTFCRTGVPVLAESLGFLYLQAVGVLPGSFSQMPDRAYSGNLLLASQRATLLSRPGDEIRGYECRSFNTTDPGNAFKTLFPYKADQKFCIQSCAPAPVFHTPPCRKKTGEKESVFAGFAHLYFPSNDFFAARFIDAARMSENRCASCKK